jgi:hypothetical protein
MITDLRKDAGTPKKRKFNKKRKAN